MTTRASRNSAAQRSRNLVIASVAAVSAWAIWLVARNTILIVEARQLLPRWDLATHLEHGWVDYHLLTTGRIPSLLWDLWNQGYWPPLLSLFQIPFYVLLGADMTSGLWVSPVAFALTCVVGAVVLWGQWRGGALLPIAVFVSLLITSPFVLAYSSVTMTEVSGALAQLVVIFCYERYARRRDTSTSRALAVSLAGIFFLKYNYFLMVAVPLAAFEFLERTQEYGIGGRARTLRALALRAARSWSARLVALYAVFVAAILITGGIQFHAFGQRVSMRTVGNSGQIVLYVLAARLWYLTRRGRVDWQRIQRWDPVVRPLLVWLVLPVTLWFASPHPNHIRDFFNLVINLDVAEPTGAPDTATYSGALRSLFVYREWIAWLVFGFSALALTRYGRQPRVMRVLLLVGGLQCLALAIHHTKFPRFLLPTFVLLCLVAAGELAAWMSTRPRRMAAAVLAPCVLGAAMLATARIVTADPFRVLAFEHYTDSPALLAAFSAMRPHLRPGDRLLFIGESEQISPALLRWQLGPPSGVPCAPSPIGGERRLDPAQATRVLLIVRPEAPRHPINAAQYNPARIAEVQRDIDSGELVPLAETHVADLGLVLHLFGRVNAVPVSARRC